MRNIKCSSCGLANFVTEDNCRRCQARLFWEPEPIPELNQMSTSFKGWFDVGMTFLVAIFGLELLAIVLCRGQVVGERITMGLAFGFLSCGIILLILTHIWLIARIYEESPLWAIAAFFVPIACLIAVCKWPEKTKRAFVGRLICVGIALFSLPIPPTEYVTRPKVFTDARRYIRFDYPYDWSVEDMFNEDALSVTSPSYGSKWQARVSIKTSVDKGFGGAAEHQLAAYIEEMRQAKQNFVLKSSRTLTHPSGLQGIELVYTCTTPKDNLPITKKDLAIWHPDGRVVDFTVTAATDEWPRFEAQINAILDSVRLMY